MTDKRPPRRRPTRQNPTTNSKPIVETKSDDPGARDGTTYRVGHGHPPRHSRFKPGRSGNPKGRPKRSLNLRTLVKKVCEQIIEVREGQQVRRMSTLELFVKTTVNRSLKRDDPKAAASFLMLLRQSGYSAESEEAAADPLSAAHYESIVAEFLAGKKSTVESDNEPARPETDAVAEPPQKKSAE